MNLPISGFFSTPELLQSLGKIFPQSQQTSYSLGFCEIIQQQPGSELSPPEKQIWTHLVTPKRQKEWLAGRRAAKRAALHLIRQREMSASQLNVSAADLVVANLDSGAPKFLAPFERLKLSISHSNDIAMALCSNEIEGAIDIERIKPQKPASFRFYLREPERPSVMSLEESRQSQLALRYFSLKEAVYKLLKPPRGHSIWDIEIKTPLSSERIQTVHQAFAIHGRLADYAAQTLNINPEVPGISGLVLSDGSWIFSAATFNV